MMRRRELLKGVSLGAGGVVFAPLLRSVAAQVDGTFTTPKRVVFVLFDNGFHEAGAQPAGVPLGSDKVRELPLEPLDLPHDIEPFTPWKDRLAIVQGLRGGHLSPNHGAGFGALSGASGGLGEDKFRRVDRRRNRPGDARHLPAPGTWSRSGESGNDDVLRVFSVGSRTSDRRSVSSRTGF